MDALSRHLVPNKLVTDHVNRSWRLQKWSSEAFNAMKCLRIRRYRGGGHNMRSGLWLF